MVDGEGCIVSSGEELRLTEGRADMPDPLASWRAELHQHDPRSHEYAELAAALAALTTEFGIVEPGDEESAGDALFLPPGFSALSQPVDLAQIPAEQFWHLVPPLHDEGKDYLVPVDEWTTDTGRRVRVIDMRPLLAHQLKHISPPPEAAEHINKYFFRDLKIYADTGVALHTMTRPGRANGSVIYNRVNGSKARSFWVPVSARNYGGDGVHMVARVGDSGDSQQHERTIYQRIFDIRLCHP